MYIINAWVCIRHACTKVCVTVAWDFLHPKKFVFIHNISLHYQGYTHIHLHVWCFILTVWLTVYYNIAITESLLCSIYAPLLTQCLWPIFAQILYSIKFTMLVCRYVTVRFCFLTEQALKQYLWIHFTYLLV